MKKKTLSVAAAALAAVIKEIGKLPKDAVPVVLLPDHGERYMSKIFVGGREHRLRRRDLLSPDPADL